MLRKHTLFFPCLLVLCLLCQARHSMASPALMLVATGFTSSPADTIRRFNATRILLLSDTSLQARQKVKAQRFYQKLQKLFYRTELSRKLFDLLVVPPSANIPPAEPTMDPAKRYKDFEGKVIGNITIRKLALFGPSVRDTSQYAENWFMEMGNQLHFHTRSRVIRKNLLIEEGDKLQLVQLRDSERVLRQLPFIRDALLYLKPRSGSQESDTVDLLVVTQDYFPYSAGGSFSSINKLGLSLDNTNLAGLGHQLSNEVLYNKYLSPKIGYRGTHTIPNLYGLFIRSQLEFTRTDREKQEGLHLSRNFYTPDIRWAGGLHLAQTEITKPVLFLDTRYDTLLNYKHLYSNVWLARAFMLSRHPNNLSSSRTRLIVAGRFGQTNFRERPATAIREQPYFHHRRLYLGSIGLSSRRYFQDQYVYGFGRTEDIPTGYLANLKFGYENAEFADRPYAGLSLQWARYFWQFGYFYGQFDTETYLANYRTKGWRAEQRLLHLKGTYFSPLLPWKAFHFRQLVSLNYTYGDRRLPHEFLTIGYEHIRGLHTYAVRGTQRLSARLETISFTPFNILGFQLAAFGFADIAILNQASSFSLKGESFQGYGLGLRVRNDHLTFNTFQLRLMMYPNTPGKTLGISISGIPSQLFRDFTIGEPRPFQFY